MSAALPSGWAEVSLADVVSQPRSKVAPADYPDLPFVGMDHIAPGGMDLLGSVPFGSMKSNGGLFLEGDVLYGRMRPYLNKIHRAKSTGACSAEFIVFPRSKAIDGDFLAYTLHHRTFVNFASAQSSGDRPRVDFGDLSKYEFALPPMPEQKRIVSKLDELFSRIDDGERALERVSKLVERYRQSVLKAAVTGELTRDWREARKAAGQPIESGEALLTRILTARRQAWEQAQLAMMQAKGIKPKNDAWRKKYKNPAPPDTSELPKLPEGWGWASPIQIESTTENSLAIGPFGSNLKVADYTNEGVPLIFVRNIRSQSFGGSKAKFVSTAKAAELSSHIARAGDVLITKMGEPPGDACVYPTNSPDAVITADCIKWTLHPMMPSADYIAGFVNSAIGRTQIGRITKGVAQQKVSLDRFRQIAIALPGPLEQQEIAERIAIELHRLESIVDLVKVELKRANALRQGLLKAAFAGQLVEQDPNDEPASALLERIAAECVESSSAAPKRGRKKKFA